jgi:hypothetical protein
MSSFEEIKNLFTNELINSPQYLVATKIKNLIIADILAPNVNYSFSYIFVDSDYVDINNKDYEENIIWLCLKVILGVDCELINNGMFRGINIIMSKFLN